MNEKTKPNSKFEIGDFAIRRGGLVEIANKYWEEKTGKWEYSINYIKIDNVKNELYRNGGSCCWVEDEFVKITDPHILLLTTKHKLEAEIRDIKTKLKHLEANAQKIVYALDIITPKEEEHENE